MFDSSILTNFDSFPFVILVAHVLLKSVSKELAKWVLDLAFFNQFIDRLSEQPRFE
jgi:uncharacterized membrane protein YbaN (DUF454 family)